jgi:shikimate kinase
MTTGEDLILISALTSGIVSIVNAIATGWGRSAGRLKTEANHADLVHRAEDASSKLDVIHTQTNSNLTKLNTELAVAQERISSLEKMLTTLMTPKEPV